MNKQRNLLYISHGGGPLPLQGDPAHREMVERLQEIRDLLPRPSAILVISAHWETRVPSITAGAHPGLIYDYYGFPPESYEIQYPSPGKPELAQKIHQTLQAAGIPAELDDQRGYDHGMFVPLKIMYPAADIPVVQLSLMHHLDAKLHLAVGKALKTLDEDNLLVIGSGFSFHNMRAFFAADTPDIQARNLAFEAWLQETCASTDLTEADREQRLIHWEQAPEARFCQPREEHLLPLHVCYGMAGKVIDGSYPARILGKQASMFHWSIPA